MLILFFASSSGIHVFAFECKMWNHTHFSILKPITCKDYEEESFLHKALHKLEIEHTHLTSPESADAAQHVATAATLAYALENKSACCNSDCEDNCCNSHKNNTVKEKMQQECGRFYSKVLSLGADVEVLQNNLKLQAQVCFSPAIIQYALQGSQKDCLNMPCRIGTLIKESKIRARKQPNWLIQFIHFSATKSDEIPPIC